MCCYRVGIAVSVAINDALLIAVTEMLQAQQLKVDSLTKGEMLLCPIIS